MIEIHRWQHQYLGISAFPKGISALELRAFFSFDDKELVAIQSRNKDNLKIAAAVQLGFLKMTGNPMHAIRLIPAKLLRHVAAQLKVPPITIASLKSIYSKRPKTMYEHQWWAMETLGFSRATAKELDALLPYLIGEASHAVTADVLVELGKLWLYQHRFIIVAERTIRDFARQAIAESEERLFQLIRGQLSAQKFAYLERAVLNQRPNTEVSVLEWLQQPPRRKSINAIRERMARIEFLKNIGVHKIDLEGIVIEKIKAYASELYNIRPAKYRELKDPTRTIRLVCFLKICLMQATDAAIMLGARQISKIVRSAYEKARTLEAESSVSYRQVVTNIIDRAHDPTLSDSNFRKFVFELEEGLETPDFPTRAAAARWILSEPNPALRSLLNELQKLDIEAEAGNPNKECVDYLRQLYGQKTSELPIEPGVTVPSSWKDIIEGEDRERAMRGLEAATLLSLRKSLRGGAVYVDHSEKFRGRHRLLIDEQVWIKEKNKRYAQLNLPLSAEDFLDCLTAELGEKLLAVDAAILQGKISVEDGSIRIPRVRASESRPEVETNRNDLFAKIGVVQLPDLILDMDSRTGFSKIILGRLARNQTELLQVYAGMLANGCSLDASSVCLMIPQLKPSQVTAGIQLFQNQSVIRAANESVTGYQRRLPITSIWGDGTLASSDMMSIDVSRQIWVARLDPKRNVSSVGTYTHLSDFWSVIYDQPIVLNERQAGAALEGAIRQTEVEIDQLAVDTHGYTEFSMGMAKMEGFALCPRLARLAERKLYLPSNMKTVPQSLRDIVVPNISLRKIISEWDNLVRVASSIETGHTSATVALARFGSASSDSPIYRAGVHLGRLVRSIYLCDYFLSEDLRRTINRILVYGESVHTLQRAIYAGTFSKPRGQREEELYAISGSLTLLTNLCLAWTTGRMQDVLLGDGNLPEIEEDLVWLRHVSPAHYANINFRGTFDFPVNKYQELFVPESKRSASA